MRVQLAILVLCVLWAGIVIAEEAVDESQAISKIELLGGNVTTDDSVPDRPVIRIGFQEGAKFNDKYCHLLTSFMDLEKLQFHQLQTRITDAGLEDLRELKSLKALDVQGAAITDAGLKHLAGLTNLQELGLEETRITDAGLIHLKQLTQLEYLWLNRTQITDTGLAHLAGLTKLKYLWLNKTQVTSAGIAKLKVALPETTIVGP